PGMSDKVLEQWKDSMTKHYLVIKAAHPEVLAALPTGKPFKGWLAIPKGDQLAAKDLVDSIVRQPPRNAGRNDSRVPREDLPAPITDPYRVWMQVLGPALGLILTAVVALLWCVVWAVNIADAHNFKAVHLLGTIGVLLSLGAVGFLGMGAV